MILFTNRFYSDSGLLYIFERLRAELGRLSIPLTIQPSPLLTYPMDDFREKLAKNAPNNAVIFWDKDVRVARAIERCGVRLLPNSADALAVCDDKEDSYARLSGSSLPLIKTLSNPLMFDVNNEIDDQVLLAAEKLGYPIVIKENKGSQGRQVYLANNRTELVHYAEKLRHIPHIYQQFRGEAGSDVRVYLIDSKAVAAVRRFNTTDFKANVASGGKMELFPLNDRLNKLATEGGRSLGLSYGSVDFLVDGEDYLFVEANSNAYFRGIEQLGVSIADKLAQSIKRNITN